MFTQKEKEHLKEVVMLACLTVAITAALWMMVIGPLFWKVAPVWVTHGMPLFVGMMAIGGVVVASSLSD